MILIVYPKNLARGLNQVLVDESVEIRVPVQVPSKQFGKYQDSKKIFRVVSPAVVLSVDPQVDGTLAPGNFMIEKSYYGLSADGQYVFLRNIAAPPGRTYWFGRIDEQGGYRLERGQPELPYELEGPLDELMQVYFERRLPGHYGGVRSNPSRRRVRRRR